jgi:hypothetical protein
MNTIQLPEIVWPVFRLKEEQPHQKDGVVFYYYESIKDTDEALVHRQSIKIVDDKNIPGATLGIRRMQFLDSETKLFPIRTAIYFLADLIKLAKTTTWFIDTTGRVFQYKKSHRAKLQSFKLKKIVPSCGMGCVVELESKANRFKSMVYPQPEQAYAVVATFNRIELLYGFSETPIKPTWRMV